MEIYCCLFILFLKPVVQAKRIAGLLGDSGYMILEVVDYVSGFFSLHLFGGPPPRLGLKSCGMYKVQADEETRRQKLCKLAQHSGYDHKNLASNPLAFACSGSKRVGQRHLLQHKETKVMSACCAQRCSGVHAPKILRWSFCWVHHLNKDPKVKG